jgi:NAD(P)-dependent dehydrogenase (short-subunit alcohol dehydrogenase family)
MAEYKSDAQYQSLKGKSVFVTGGGSGIGEGIVEAFAAQGAKVAFVDIAVDSSLALCDRLAAMGYIKPLFLLRYPRHRVAA